MSAESNLRDVASEEEDAEGKGAQHELGMQAPPAASDRDETRDEQERDTQVQERVQMREKCEHICLSTHSLPKRDFEGPRTMGSSRRLPSYPGPRLLAQFCARAGARVSIAVAPGEP